MALYADVFFLINAKNTKTMYSKNTINEALDEFNSSNSAFQDPAFSGFPDSAEFPYCVNIMPNENEYLDIAM